MKALLPHGRARDVSALRDGRHRPNLGELGRDHRRLGRLSLLRLHDHAPHDERRRRLDRRLDLLHHGGRRAVALLAQGRTEQDFEAAYQDIIDQNTPLFEKQTESLTTYQMNFLRAVIDGVHSEFTTQEVLQKYQLGSSANVSIIKRALVKKELIEIEKRQVVIPDPVMKVWLKKELGI